MRCALVSCGLVAGILAAVTTAMADQISFALVHGNPLAIVILFGVAVALAKELPGLEGLVGIFLYQFAYFFCLAIIVAVIVGLFRVRARRIKAKNERQTAS